MDRFGTMHGLSCRKSQGCYPRHASINMASAKGTYQQLGSLPNWSPQMYMPLRWQASRWCLRHALEAWLCIGVGCDMHALIPLSPPMLGWHLERPVEAEQLKNRKYAELLISHHFTPIAIETSGVFGPEVTAFLHIHDAASCGGGATGQCSCGAWHGQVPPADSA